MSYYTHFQQCNQYNPVNFKPFSVLGEQIGQLRPVFAEKLMQVSNSFNLKNNILYWEPSGKDTESLTHEMSEITDKLLRLKLLPYRHNELYPVTTGKRENPLFLMDRALIPYFGISAFGQHMNGFVRNKDDIFMWIGRRSNQKRHAPGKLDNMVAGGLPWGISLQENLAKECWEEAGIPAELAAEAKHVSSISYRRESKAGLKPDTMFCYDLELPESFIPHCTDGEVEKFELLPLQQVAQLVFETSDFKLNCNLVIIDFLIRHQYIKSDHDEYAALVEGLNSRVKF